MPVTTLRGARRSTPVLAGLTQRRTSPLARLHGGAVPTRTRGTR